MGQGAWTALAQIGAEALGIDLQQMRYRGQDGGVDADQLANVVACRHAQAEVQALEIGCDVRRHRGPRALRTRLQQGIAYTMQPTGVVRMSHRLAASVKTGWRCSASAASIAIVLDDGDGREQQHADHEEV